MKLMTTVEAHWVRFNAANNPRRCALAWYQTPRWRPSSRSHPSVAYTAYSSTSRTPMSSDDEYATFNFDDYTEDDFKRADADVVACLGQPQITIQVESAGTATPESESPGSTAPRAKGKQRADLNALSPLARHRRNGVLSVTDLASLAWCEVQYDYGLRQRRSLPIASRPQSFVSEQGKTITVAKEVAAANDKITKQGRALHKELEREVKPEELKVDISSEEEQWALRCGMDEVVIKPEKQPMPQKRAIEPSGSPSKAKKPRRSLSPSQHLVTEYLPGSTSSDPSTPPRPDAPTLIVPVGTEPSSISVELPASSPNSFVPRKFLHLIDTKTRRTNSLPRHPDTLPSRIQLMLYYRLLADMTSTSPPFDFAAMWRRLRVDPAATFSTKFLVQAGLLDKNTNWNISCLNDLSKAYTDTVHSLGVMGVDTNLELVYRLRSGQGQNQGKKSKRRSTSPIITQEELDIARAVEASLADTWASAESVEQETSTTSAAHTESLITSDTSSDAGTPSVSASMDSVQLVGIKGTSGEGNANTPSRSNIEVDKRDLTPIGTKEFEYERTTLDRHIAHALQWWRGERSPQGVSLKDSRRCRTCEYENSCEWREQKALEVQERLQSR
ncbi:hypothetical protein DXG01_001011 [Tephrocybe rancida]|nr:hypothetical protein DXG01_001011 [Tephrocybe rancida]